MFGSIGIHLLAMNPVGDKQNLQPCGICAPYIGHQPVAHRQGPLGLCCGGSAAWASAGRR